MIKNKVTYLDKNNKSLRLVKFNRNHISKTYLVWLNDKKLKFSQNRFSKHNFPSAIKYLKENTKNKNITRVIPLPFIGMKKGPIVIFPPDKSVKNFFKHLGKVVEVKSEKVSKSFWATSSFMAPFYNLVSATSDWLTSKGVNRKEAEDYTRELFLALAEDAINKKKLSLKQLVVESQTPGGTNAFVLKELKKKKFYKVQQKVLNSIFKKF